MKLIGLLLFSFLLFAQNPILGGGGGGGGGGAGNSAVLSNACISQIASSGTVTLDLSAATGSSCQIVNATGDITIATSGQINGVSYSFTICTDTTLRVFTFPAAFHRIGKPQVISNCYFNPPAKFDGTFFQGEGSDETQYTIRYGGIRAAPTTCGANGTSWIDSTDLLPEFCIAGDIVTNHKIGVGTPLFLEKNGTIPISGTHFGALSGFGGNTTLANFQHVLPFSGTLHHLYVTTATTQPGSGTLTITVQKAGINCNISIVIAASAPAGTYSDTTNCTVVGGTDLLNYQIVNSSGAAVSAQITSLAIWFQ